MSLGVEVQIDGVFERPGRIVRNDRERAFVGDLLAQLIGVVGAVGHDDLGRKPFDQRCGLKSIATMTGGQGEAHGAAQASERLGEITPRRAGPYDPEHAFHEHLVVPTRRTLLIRTADDQWRDPLLLIITQHQPIHHSQDCLQAVLNHASESPGILRVHSS